MEGRLPAVLDYKWELYNVSNDFSQAIDLVAKEPAKLKELQDPFWTEAEKYNVLPIENSRIDRWRTSGSWTKAGLPSRRPNEEGLAPADIR